MDAKNLYRFKTQAQLVQKKNSPRAIKHETCGFKGFLRVIKHETQAVLRHRLLEDVLR